jgi:XTP/dITP diphosphohydrolase
MFRSIAEFVEEFRGVHRRTRRVVAQLPVENVEGRPYAGAFSAGDLARHIALTERFMWAETLSGRPSAYNGCGPEFAADRDAILELTDRLHAETVAIIGALADDTLAKPCLTPGGAELNAGKWLRLMLEHEIHHRGQLYTSLGALGIETPPLYGLKEETVRRAAGETRVGLLVASQNAGKLAEMKGLVAGLPYAVVGPRDIGIDQSPEETGETFLENAAQKARHYSRRSGLLTLADDSGLSVAALGGGPGLHSARFGGEGLDDAGRVQLLLSKLEGVLPGERGARFTSAVAIADGGAILFELERHVDGRIAAQPRGTGGFGYDPVFIPAGREETFGEMQPAEKDRLSHRGQSLAAAREFLLSLRSS